MLQTYRPEQVDYDIETDDSSEGEIVGEDQVTDYEQVLAGEVVEGEQSAVEPGSRSQPGDTVDEVERESESAPPPVAGDSDGEDDEEPIPSFINYQHCAGGG